MLQAEIVVHLLCFAGGNGDSGRERAAFVIQETGVDLDPVYESAKEADARHTHADVTKAQSSIGYEPTTSIRAGVSRFIEWYRHNWDWYEPLVLAA